MIYTTQYSKEVNSQDHPTLVSAPPPESGLKNGGNNYFQSGLTKQKKTPKNKNRPIKNQARVLTNDERSSPFV